MRSFFCNRKEVSAHIVIENGREVCMDSKSVNPLLEEIKEDYRSLRVVSPAYAGGRGELTAILQYVYQSVLLGQTGREREAKVLMKIAADEMRHLELLGSAITRLGAPPVFTNCPPYPVGYYSASCVNYAKNLEAMICVDVQSERTAIAEYGRMLAALDNPPLETLIRMILGDEEEHLKILEDMQKGL